VSYLRESSNGIDQIEGSPAKKARILRLLIERIDVAPDGISVTLHAAGTRSILAELVARRPGS
jgi:hypothetical protein